MNDKPWPGVLASQSLANVDKAATREPEENRQINTTVQWIRDSQIPSVTVKPGVLGTGQTVVVFHFFSENEALVQPRQPIDSLSMVIRKRGCVLWNTDWSWREGY
jgi:hypothetical protein